MLCIHLGTPPERFDWQWTDKDREFHRDGVLTPQEFAAKYVELPVADYVCLVHDPRATSPQGRTFTVEYLGNVIGAPPVTYLNVDVPLLKRLTAASLSAGEPVWFGCDVGKMMSNDYGHLGRRPVRPAVGLRHRRSTLDKADAAGVPREPDDARDAVHRGRPACGRGVPRGGGWRTAGARTRAGTASTR